jgi:hypothetical protein
VIVAAKADVGAAHISRSHNPTDASADAQRRLMHRTQIKGGKPFFDPKTLDLQA